MQCPYSISQFNEIICNHRNLKRCSSGLLHILETMESMYAESKRAEFFVVRLTQMDTVHVGLRTVCDRSE
jgi:hypothetical protein